MAGTMTAGKFVARESFSECKELPFLGEVHPNQRHPGLSAGSAITGVLESVNDSDSQPANVGISYDSFALEPWYTTANAKISLTEHADAKYNTKHG